MAKDHVHCVRTIARPPNQIWAQLQNFDVSWHPHVTSCNLSRNSSGAVLREFRTIDGGRLIEQRTYLSTTDRVLHYALVSGIEGISTYHARITVSADGPYSLVTWHADISAEAGHLARITAGTRAVFEAGLTALESIPPPALRPEPAPASRVALRTGAIPGTPHLSYLTGGAHPADAETLVLFLHGIGGQATNWSEQIATFGRSYRVAALNLRGYGESSLGFAPTQIDDHCSDILAMADHFGAGRLVLVGLSMGSWIATSFAMRHADRLAGLVLAGGCTGMSEADPQERETFRVSREAPLSLGQSPADFAQAVVDVIAGPSAAPKVKADLRRSMAAVATETYRDALNCFCNPAEAFDFSKIACPVLLLTGQHDALAPPAEIRRVSERIHEAGHVKRGQADVQFEIVDNAGHVCNLERPEAFNRWLGTFLERLPGMAQPTKSGRAKRQRDKRAKILRAAHQEFCAAGFDGASMNRLAKAAEVSKPTLYQYFGDKEGLFAAVLDEARASLVAPLEMQGQSLVDMLWHFSWTYAAFVLRPDMLSLARLVLGEAGRRPETALRYHQNGPARAFEDLVAFVSTAVADGELAVDDERLAANDLWSLILSGPRDHYLHHVAERPTDTELLRTIGHGLSIFLTAYSRNKTADQELLTAKIKAKSAEISE